MALMSLLIKQQGINILISHKALIINMQQRLGWMNQTAAKVILNKCIWCLLFKNPMEARHNSILHGFSIYHDSLYKSAVQCC